MKNDFLLIFMFLIGVSCSAQDVTELEKMLLSRGLMKTVKDWSEEERVDMEEPTMAVINLTGFDKMPTTKREEKKGWVEIWDGEGNYFHKPVMLHGQGGYSLKFPKRNFSLHLCDIFWNEEGGAEVRIGDWVRQSSFHFKAFYNDFLRGFGEVGYKVYELMIADRQPFWNRVGYVDESRARCFPDGFPCAVYLNGTFYGVFAWQLKKSRKNMNMKKYEVGHIHLDGDLNDKNLFGGNINWTQFEVRNPQQLYVKNGSHYDGNYPKELLDSKCAAFSLSDDAEDIKEDKRRTHEVKQSIIRLSQYGKELETLERKGLSEKEMRLEIEQRYEIESLIDYYLHYVLTYNCDGSLKNWQWFTYDGKRWLVTPYDLDQTFGINLYGVVRPANLPMERLTSGPFRWIDRYYQDDIRQRWYELREQGLVATEQIVAFADDWYERVGEEFYAMERMLWAESPCYNEAECNAGWEVYNDWSIYGDTKAYNAAVYYYAGDICKYEGRLWCATANVTGVKPFRRNANIDNLERLHVWIAERIDFLDNLWGYESRPTAIVEIAETSSSSRQLIGIFTLSGVKVKRPVSGVYIYVYSDGTTKKMLIQ